MQRRLRNFCRRRLEYGAPGGIEASPAGRSKSLDSGRSALSGGNNDRTGLQGSQGKEAKGASASKERRISKLKLWRRLVSSTRISQLRNVSRTKLNKPPATADAADDHAKEEAVVLGKGMAMADPQTFASEALTEFQGYPERCSNPFVTLQWPSRTSTHRLSWFAPVVVAWIGMCSGERRRWWTRLGSWSSMRFFKGEVFKPWRNRE